MAGADPLFSGGEAIEVAVIGDRFMTCPIFVEALRSVGQRRFTFRTLELAWPDEAMEHGYVEAGAEGLREYFGHSDQVIATVQSAPILITHLAPITARVFDSLPDLKLIAVSRGGPVNIDMEAARAHGVSVVNTPGRNASAVAEFTIGAILAQTHNITRGHDALRGGDYRGDLYRHDVVGEELSALTVGVIGYGHVGRLVVTLLRAFGCPVLICDPYVQITPQVRDDPRIEAVDLDDLLHRSDVITLHQRVTPETTHMIDAEAFAKMTRKPTLINTARGPLVDYAALYQALTSGQLRGAMLDTFAREPPLVDDPLLKLPNVTLTPHIAGASRKTVREAARKIADDVHRWLDGKTPLHLFRA